MHVRGDVKRWWQQCDTCATKRGPELEFRVWFTNTMLEYALERIRIDIAGPSPENDRRNRDTAWRPWTTSRSGQLFTKLVKYFGEQDWLFHDTNVRSLLVQLTSEDCDIFYFDMKQLNWASYLERCVKGVRKCILKDDLNTLPKARER